jgi:hypothetical protein
MVPIGLATFSECPLIERVRIGAISGYAFGSR